MAVMAVKRFVKFTFLLALFLSFFASAKCLLEEGAFNITVSKSQHDGKDLSPYRNAMTKALYEDSKIILKIQCGPTDFNFKVRWLIRWSPCAAEYLSIQQDQAKKAIESYMRTPDFVPLEMDVHYKKVNYLKAPEELETNPTLNCGSHPTFHLLALPNTTWIEKEVIYPNFNDHSNSTNKSGRKKRDTDNESATPTVTTKKEPSSTTKETVKTTKKQETPKPEPTKKPSEGKSKPPPTQKGKQDPNVNEEHVIAVVPKDGLYLFVLDIMPVNPEEEFEMNVKVQMKGPRGYLSANEWPLLPFYGTMCLVYIIFGIAWLVLLACNWRDLLRIQFWIGGVILLGMLEKAVFFAEYESVNATGQSVKGALIFAELVSSMKRALARMLVVIVSLGFGIVKPRLGPLLHRVMGMGTLYFILATVEGCLRVLKPKADQSKTLLIANIPLAVLDAAICWWIFTSLVQTTRTLRLRRNIVKLSLYRHFTNTLIFCILASVAYMIWSIKQHRLTTCLSDWKELWVDDAFWHLLFSVILLVIMILWRPSINNQRYAFSPLLDADEEELAEGTMNDAFEGMKMRGKNANSNQIRYDPQSKADEDLKWVEENIPASVADTALPSLLDSDEEIMTTKFEVSKME